MTPASNDLCRTAVYRLFDASGQLLYVGIGPLPEERWRAHSKKPWWPLVVTRTVVWHGTRDDALTEEALAIATESPRFNIREGVTPTASSARVNCPHVTAQIARKRFAEVLDLMDDQGTVTITRQGKRAGVLLTSELYEECLAAGPELLALRRRLADLRTV